jgi:hypothetical protein
MVFDERKKRQRVKDKKRRGGKEQRTRNQRGEHIANICASGRELALRSITSGHRKVAGTCKTSGRQKRTPK